MSKKILLVATICFLLAVGTAYSAESREGNAFYTGARFGFQSINADVTLQQVGSDPTNDDWADYAFEGGAFVGWKRYVNKWFFGFEVEYMDSKAEVERSASYYRTTFKEGPGFSLSARGGYEFVDDTFVTARVGWIRREYTVADWYSSDYRYARDEDLDGVVFGLGIEYFITSSISILADFRYTEYTDEISYTHFRPTAWNTKFEPSTATFSLGVAYEF
jgi:opacity protein-like surface antigen